MFKIDSIEGKKSPVIQFYNILETELSYYQKEKKEKNRFYE